MRVSSGKPRESQVAQAPRFEAFGGGTGGGLEDAPAHTHFTGGHSSSSCPRVWPCTMQLLIKHQKTKCHVAGLDVELRVYPHSHQNVNAIQDRHSADYVPVFTLCIDPSLPWGCQSDKAHAATDETIQANKTEPPIQTRRINIGTIRIQSASDLLRVERGQDIKTTKGSILLLLLLLLSLVSRPAARAGPLFNSSPPSPVPYQNHLKVLQDCSISLQHESRYSPLTTFSR